MATSGSKKYGNLRVVRGGQYGALRASDDERFERDLRAAFAKMRGADGKVPGRAFYEIAEDVQHPWRLIARRIREARAKRVPREDVQAVVKRIEAYVDRLYGFNTGEYDIAS